MTLLSFLSICILIAYFGVISYLKIENLPQFPLEAISAQAQGSQSTSIPNTKNDSNNTSIQTPLFSGDTHADSSNNTNTSSPGIQIAYPRGWIANELGNGTVTIMTPLRTDLMRFTASAVNLPPSLKNMTIDELVELNLNGLRQQLSNFSLLESNTTTISPENQTAHMIVYTNTNKDPNSPLSFKTMQIFTKKDNQFITISYVSEESQYPKNLPTIERMIDSITFKKR